MSPNYSLLPSAHQNSSIRRVSNISSLYLEKTSFAVSEAGRSSNAGVHGEQERPESTPGRYDEDTASIHFVKLVVLGAPGVGKTSILESFVGNPFPGEPVPTTAKREYTPSLILDTTIFELKIVDLPAVSRFPATSDEEWESFRFCGLRSAHAYLLVFDLSSSQSFQFITTIREQILNSRDTSQVPILVVGNKFDLVPAFSPERNRLRLEMAALVKKVWKSHYIECSAKCNYNLMHTFKILAQELKISEEIQHGERNCRDPATTCCFRCIP